MFRLIRIWTTQWCSEHSFFVFNKKYLFWENFWNIEPKLIRIHRVWWWFSLFYILDWKLSFWLNLVERFKVVVRFSWNLVPWAFPVDKIWWRCSLFSFRLFLQLYKKIIWHIHFNWLISQEFTRRDLKPVAFLDASWNSSIANLQLSHILTPVGVISEIKCSVKLPKNFYQWHVLFLNIYSFLPSNP